MAWEKDKVREKRRDKKKCVYARYVNSQQPARLPADSEPLIDSFDVRQAGVGFLSGILRSHFSVHLYQVRWPAYHACRSIHSVRIRRIQYN